MRRLIFISGMLLLLLPVMAQQKPVTFDMAFQSAKPKLTLTIGRADGWIDDRHYVWIERDEDGKPQQFRVDAQTGERTPYRKAQEENADKTGFHRTEDRSSETWLDENDVFYQTPDMASAKQVTNTPGEEQNPRLSPNGKHIAYTRDGNLFVADVANGAETKLTNDGSETVYNGFASWVYFEEILGRSSRYRAFWWSPDSKRICYMRFDDAPVSTFPIYHEEGNYGHLEITRYPKSGEDNPRVRMGSVALSTGATSWFDFDQAADEYLAWPFWTPDSQKVHVQWMNRDQNHLVIYECDASSGTKKAIYEEKQDTWVEYFNDITYLEDGSGFLLRSDKDGWRHLYYHDMQGKLKGRLTSGDWRVMSILGVDIKKKRVYFSAKKSDMAGLDLMSVSLRGKKLKTHTEPGGTHRVTLSPDFSYFLDRYSDYQTPRQVRLHKMKGTLVKTLADSKNPEMAKYNLAKVEHFTIPASDGYQLPAWWVIPQDLDQQSSAKKYGVIFRIYSGPDAPTVRNSFSRTLADHYYADKGVITISVDHRASGHFGKKGVANMHRSLGKWEVHDLKTAVAWLKSKPFIDANRIGITGHSYGGYMTLLAMAKAPEVFTHGVAGAPVTDWALYDTVYTERFMDRPQDNPDGYRESSVLEYAKSIRGELRLIHGTIDDNVHFQNSLQLVKILTDEGIPFDFMAYPGSRHGIKQRKHRLEGEHAFWFRHFLGRSFKKAAAP